jgi:hypothetical protein
MIFEFFYDNFSQIIQVCDRLAATLAHERERERKKIPKNIISKDVKKLCELIQVLFYFFFHVILIMK